MPRLKEQRDFSRQTCARFLLNQRAAWQELTPIGLTWHMLLHSIQTHQLTCAAQLLKCVANLQLTVQVARHSLPTLKMSLLAQTSWKEPMCWWVDLSSVTMLLTAPTAGSLLQAMDTLQCPLLVEPLSNFLDKPVLDSWEQLHASFLSVLLGCNVFLVLNKQHNQ